MLKYLYCFNLTLEKNTVESAKGYWLFQRTKNHKLGYFSLFKYLKKVCTCVWFYLSICSFFPLEKLAIRPSLNCENKGIPIEINEIRKHRVPFKPISRKSTKTGQYNWTYWCHNVLTSYEVAINLFQLYSFPFLHLQNSNSIQLLLKIKWGTPI